MPEPIIQSEPPKIDESEMAYPGWKVVLAGFFGVMVSVAAVVPYTFGLFIKPLAESFGWNREATSAGFSIAALTIAATSPCLGFLLDRYEPRRIILPCIVVFSAAYASLALLTSHLLHFYLTFFIIGLVGQGTAFMGYSRAISTWFNRRRGFALSIMLAGCAVGAMVLPVLAQAVITHLGWRFAYVILGGLAFVVGFPLTAVFVRERPGAQQDHHASTEHGVRVTAALTKLSFWIIAATACLCAISVNGTLAHISALLTDRGVSTSGAAWCVAIIGATGLIGNLFTGIFLDRFFGPRVWQVMLLMTVFGIVLLSVAYSLAAGLVASALIGFSMGGEGTIMPYVLGRYFGLKRFSTLYAFTWTTFTIGAAIGPVLVGRAFDTLGSYRPTTIQLLALPALIPCLLMFMLPRYKIQTGGGPVIDIPPEFQPPEIAQ
jgi:MFS family permease